jgi:hypothetical protein
MGHRGLMLDALQSVRMVTANGSLVTASKNENTDLFWAVRGAGHNFGIVASATYMVYDITNKGEVMIADLVFPAAANHSFWRALQSYDHGMPSTKLGFTALALYDREHEMVRGFSLPLCNSILLTIRSRSLWSTPPILARGKKAKRTWSLSRSLAPLSATLSRCLRVRCSLLITDHASLINTSTYIPWPSSKSTRLLSTHSIPAWLSFGSNIQNTMAASSFSASPMMRWWRCRTVRPSTPGAMRLPTCKSPFPLASSLSTQFKADTCRIQEH